MEYKSRRLINNTIIFMIGNIGSKFIQFFLVPLYTYTMTTEQFGISEVVLTASNLLMPVFSVSIADGLLRFGLDKSYEKGDVLKSSLFIVAIGSLASIACIPLFRFYTSLADWLIYFLLILNLRIYRDVFAINLKNNEKNLLFAVDSLLYTLSLCVSNIVLLVIFKLGVRGYFYSYIIANIASILFLVVTGRVYSLLRKRKLNYGLIKKLLIYSMPLILNGISWWITSAADRIMIQSMINVSSAGIYSAATKIPSLVTTFTGVFSQAWMISAVKEYDDTRDKEFYRQTFRNYYGVLFLGVATIILIIKPFMSVYVGPEFKQAVLYAPMLVASAAYSALCAFLAGIYASAKKNLNVTITTLIGAIVNIVFNLFLIPLIGVHGATTATFVSWFVIFIVRIWDIRNFFPFQIEMNRIALYTVIVLVQCVTFAKYSYFVSMMVSVVGVFIIGFLERNIVFIIIKQFNAMIRRVFKR